MINVKLREKEVAKEYEDRMKLKWDEYKGTEIGDVERELESMKMTMMEMAEEVCDMRRVGGGRKGTDWWNDELEQMRKEKVRKHRIWLERNQRKVERSLRDAETK